MDITDKIELYLNEQSPEYGKTEEKKVAGMLRHVGMDKKESDEFFAFINKSGVTTGVREFLRKNKKYEKFLTELEKIGVIMGYETT